MEGSTNLTSLFIRWWYGGAVANILKYSRAAFVYSADLFSVRLCLSTLFDPWKRDVLSYEGQSLDQKFHTWTLNLASRIIGALVKIGALLSYLLFTFLLSIAIILVLVFWLAYPAIVIYLIYRSLS